MATNPHVTLTRTGRSLNPMKQMANPLIRKALGNSRSKNKPPNVPQSPSINNTNTPVAKAPRKNTSPRALKLEELHALQEKNGSLKSGEEVMRSYTLILELEIEVQFIHVGDTCLLLDPLLRTRESSVLECFMKHRGMHILHGLLRRFCRHKLTEGRSVVRKLLRVFQHLENCGVLTVEHMTCRPPRFCLHKVCKLLVKLAEHHEDSEVRDLARDVEMFMFAIWIQPHIAHEKCWWWDEVFAS